MNAKEDTNEKKEIKAEINIEITGEDEPTKYDKRRKRWATACRVSLLIFVMALICSFFTDVDIYLGGIITLSLTSVIVCLCKANEIYSDEPTARQFSDILIMPGSTDSDNDSTL